MAIGDAWDIDYVNKRIYNKKALGIDGETTVYSVQALYSHLMDIFDDLGQMDDPVPMSAQTPTAYTMVNGWFIDDESVKYLNGGAITTSGYTHPTNITGVRVLQLDGTAGLTIADIGKVVLGVTTTHTGKLLAYNTTRNVLWVRCDAADDLFNNASEAINVDAVFCGNMTEVSDSGEDLFANVYTLGTIESTPAPQIYIFQAGSRIAEWSTLTNFDRGHIDVLIKVMEADDEIDGAIITVFARQAGDLYDNFEIDLTAGGRNAVPLGTADDLNQDSPQRYIFFDTLAGGAFAAGDIIQHPVTGAVEWSAEVVAAATQLGATGIYVMGIRNYRDDGTNPIVDNDAFERADGVVTATVFSSATASLGTCYILYDAQTGAFTTGQVLTGTTSGAKRRIIADAEDGTAGMLLLDLNTGITGNNRDPYYKGFTDDEEITDPVTGDADVNGATNNAAAGYNDITIAFVNGTATYDTHSGTGINGERVTFAGGEGILLLDDTPGTATGTITLGNMTITAINGLVITGDISNALWTATQNLQSAYTMTKAFAQQTAYPYAVVVNAGDIYQAGRTLAQVYEYFKFVCQDGSLFQMYGVVGGVITPVDGQEYIIAYTGYVPAKSAPLGTFAGGKYFGAQGVWIEGMASGQSYQYTDSNGQIRSPYASIVIQVTSLGATDKVAIFRTSAGAIDKTMYTSGAGNIQNNTTFVVQEDIAIDTPAAGSIRLVDFTDMSEARHTYTSWDGATKTFSGLSPALTKDYVEGTDKAYVPFIDQVAGGATASKEVLYDSERTVLVRVRMYAPGAGNSILPFETPGTVTSAGLSVAAIRTVDGIAT